MVLAVFVKRYLRFAWEGLILRKYAPLPHDHFRVHFDEPDSRCGSRYLDRKVCGDRCGG